MFGGLKLAPLLTEIKVDIKSFKDDMEAAKAVGVAKAEEISKSLSRGVWRIKTCPFTYGDKGRYKEL